MFDNMTVFFRCGELMSGEDGQRGIGSDGSSLDNMPRVPYCDSRTKSG